MSLGKQLVYHYALNSFLRGQGKEGRENKLMIQCFCEQILLKVRKKYLCQNVSYKYQV